MAGMKRSLHFSLSRSLVSACSCVVVPLVRWFLYTSVLLISTPHAILSSSVPINDQRSFSHD